LSKHVAEFHARAETERLRRVLSTGMAVFAFVAVVVPLLLKVTSPLWLPFLLRGPQHGPEIGIYVNLVCLIIALNLMVFPFSSVLNGLQRMDISNSLTLSSQLLTAIFIVIALTEKKGILGLLCATLTVSVLTLATTASLAIRLLKETRPSLRHFDRRELVELFSFSFQMYVTQVAVVVHSNTEKFLLAHFSGLLPVSWYEAGNDLAFKIRLVPNLLLSPILPAASELNARKDTAKLEELYYRAHKYLALVGVPIVIAVVELARRFVHVWLGPGYEPVAPALAVLTAVQFINLSTGPGYLILVGRGELRPGMNSALLGLTANLILSIALISLYGFKGALFGTSAALILASVYFQMQFHALIHYPWGNYLRPYAKPLMAGMVSAAGLFFLLPYLAQTILALLAAAGTFILLYTASVLLMRGIDEFDLNTAGKLFPVPNFVRKLVLFA
jgi:O-antigen/teichoic acid export membrane protein